MKKNCHVIIIIIIIILCSIKESLIKRPYLVKARTAGKSVYLCDAIQNYVYFISKNTWQQTVKALKDYKITYVINDEIFIFQHKILVDFGLLFYRKSGDFCHSIDAVMKTKKIISGD